MIDSKTKEKGRFFPAHISENQSKDTGMAMVLIFLLIGYFSGNNIYFILAIPLLVINMVVPNIYRPVAKIWFGLSIILGTIVSKLLLTVIFFVIVTPIGIIRKIAGADSLQLKKWKKGSSSVFVVRDYIFRSDDIDKPY